MRSRKQLQEELVSLYEKNSKLRAENSELRDQEFINNMDRHRKSFQASEKELMKNETLIHQATELVRIQAAHNLKEAVRQIHQALNPGPCNNMLPLLTDTVVCKRDHGHPGAHTSDNGVQWR